MTGRFIAVVGPSGVGKDSVMGALADATPKITLARRTITRPADAGGEAFDSVSMAAFYAMREADKFALCWQAHGLHYAIPSDVDHTLASGQDVLANLSRGILEQAASRFERFVVIALTTTPDVLKTRLEQRGREDGPQIARRLERAEQVLSTGHDVHVLDNSGPLAETVARAFDILYPVRA
ncbi:phosphonate metabolism protein/1,5-bisphosphokinase (PRPP-forming) PhnN [Litoreibacter sp.]|nr:phosphonate metabolism protein/1,5-bisphosphokinase (PRPP-forming) PhnN [Litoreibacter sp.]